MFAVHRVSPPAAEPLTLAEVKAHLRVDLADDDALITRMSQAAREWVEAETGRALITQSWRLSLDDWPQGDAVTLLRPPVQAIVQVRTIGTDGAPTVWDASGYALSFGAEPQRLIRKSASWPSTARKTGAIEIDLTCGYGAAGADVPAALRQAILVAASRLYERRGGEANELAMNQAFALIAPYKVRRL